MPGRKDNQLIWMDWGHLVVDYKPGQDGRLSLLDLLDFLIIPRGQTSAMLPDVVLVFRLSAAPGTKLEHRLRVSIVGPDGERLPGPDGKPGSDFTGTTRFNRVDDDLPLVAVRPIPLKNFVFPQPGVYQFHVYLDDHPIDHIDITVLDKPPQFLRP